MSTLTTRAGKGSPLTNTEVDNNFTNLNTDKYEASDDISVGAVTYTGNFVAGMNASVTAAGSVQGDATALTKTYNLVQTASANQGVKLPDAVAGLKVTVYNSTANNIKVYPASSESIDGGSLNAPVVLRPANVFDAIATGATSWEQITADLTDLDVTSVTTSGDLTVGGFEQSGVTAALSSAGSNQGDAAQLAETITVVTTVSADTTGVKLPVAVAGRTITVFNSTATDCKLYPNSSDTIDGGSANAAITLPANTSYTLSCKDATDWRVHRPLAVYDSSGTLLN